MITTKELACNSYSFIGDAVMSLYVREFLVMNGYQRPKDLQALTLRFVSAQSQYEIYAYLNDEANIFNEVEKEWFKKGRNHIGHIPKNGNLKTYQVASGLEAIIGYLYFNDQERLKEIMTMIFEWRKL